jgi:iron complex transport system substrate-binding protein
VVKRAALILALALTACAAAPGQERARVRPTIVSLNPCTDAILVEVADPGQILALSHYSRDPAASSMDLAAARRFPATGGAVEEVAALHPDLVLDGSFIAPATRAALERLSIRLETVGIAPSVKESEAQVRRIAVLAGHPERGEALVARIEAALAANRAPQGPTLSAIVWQSGGIVAGADTLISDLLARTGFANAAAQRGMHQAEYLPLEVMLADPPEVIFAAGDGRANQDRLLSHPVLSRLADTRRERLDPGLLWCGGPTIVRAAQRLGQARRGA